MGMRSLYTNETVAVVTGGNKGIGYEIVKGLAKAGLTTILAARDEMRGLSALQQLRSEGLSNVHFQPVDISDRESAARLGKNLKETYGGLDILVNNAGVLHSHCSESTARSHVDIMYYGTKEVTEVLLPLMRPSSEGSRVIMMASSLGQLSQIESPELRQKFAEASNVAQVDQLVEQFVADVKGGDWQSKGWSSAWHGYTVAKVAELAYMRILARRLQSCIDGQKIYINGVDPGYCATDMTNREGYRSAARGAETAIWLALQPASETTNGKFYFDKKERSF